MRRLRYLFPLLLCPVLAMPKPCAAQFDRVVTAPMAWLVVSDGIGPSGGGLAGATGLVQLFRASGVVRVTGSFGLEATAARIQELFPATKLLSDPTRNSPRADGLFASIASFTNEGAGIPSLASIGGGVVRRPTNDPTKTRLTGAFIAGVESNAANLGPRWLDVTGGVRLLLMPAGDHHQIYVLALTFGVRAG